MKVKNIIKRPLIAVAILLALSGIGVTVAYHTSYGVFPNIFQPIFDQWTVTEEFVSPDNWQQCQRAPKKIFADNSGKGNIGVRVKFESYWKLSGNNSDTHESDLPLQINGQDVARANINSSTDWEYRDDGYYYYTHPLKPGQTTSSILDYVEYNCNINIIEENNRCETINETTTCTRDQYDYDNAKYHLYATVEVTDEPESFGITQRGAVIIRGSNLNTKIKSIVHNDSSINNTGYVDSEVKAIKMASALPAGFEPSNTNSFNSNSNEPDIRGWFDSATGTFYFYTEADYIETPSDMGWAFQYFDALTDISGVADWRTHNTTKMNSIFNNCHSLVNLDPVLNWETHNVTTLNYAFSSDYRIANLNGLSNWHTGKVTEMESIFYENTDLNNIDGLSNWDVSNVTNMGWLFWGDPNIPNLNGLRYWNTGKVTALNSAFNGLSSLTDISGLTNWDTHSVTTMGYLMRLVATTNLDALTNWQTGNVQYLDNAFKQMPNLKNVNGLKKWDTHSATTLNSIFAEDPSLTDISGLADWNTGNVTNIGWMFGNSQSQITTLAPLARWDVRKVTYAACAFYAMGGHFSSLDGLQNWKTNSLEDASWMFANNGSLLTDISQIADWDLSHITTITRMFSGDGYVNGSSLDGWVVPSDADTSYAFTGSNKPSWYQE